MRFGFRSRRHSCCTGQSCAEATRDSSPPNFIPARNLTLGDGIIAHALDAGLVARGARRQALVASVLAQPAAIAGAHVAEGARRRGRGGRCRLRGRHGRVRRRGFVPVMRRLVQRALEAAHQGAWQESRAGFGLVKLAHVRRLFSEAALKSSGRVADNLLTPPAL